MTNEIDREAWAREESERIEREAIFRKLDDAKIPERFADLIRQDSINGIAIDRHEKNTQPHTRGS